MFLFSLREVRVERRMQVAFTNLKRQEALEARAIRHAFHELARFRVILVR